MPQSKQKPAKAEQPKVENLPSKTGKVSGKKRGNADPKQK